jgi:heterodisulfide reductase subunit A-like polyferredoxin
VQRVAEEAGKMPNVVHAEASLYTCSDTNQQHIKDMIAEHRLNRLVVASCSPRTHEILFQETLRESGSEPVPFRHDQYPRPVFLGAQATTRSRQPIKRWT